MLLEQKAEGLRVTENCLRETKELQMHGPESGVGLKERFCKNKLQTWAQLTVWSGEKQLSGETILAPDLYHQPLKKFHSTHDRAI